jgi:hypothetical protein
MKTILLIFLAGASAWGQSAWSGGFSSQGSMVSPAVAGFRNAALPDPSLLSWNTALANTPSPGSVITVGNGTSGICAPSGCNFSVSQLTTAVASLSCGQTLKVQNTLYVLANNTWTISQNCDQAHWITIERDMTDVTFPPEGTRVDPCYAGIPQSAMPYHPYPTADTTPNTCARHMPLLQKSGSGTNILITGQYIRFIGIQWGRVNTYDLDFNLITLLNNGGCTAADTACMNLQAQHIIFDRNIFAGDAQRQTTRAISMGGCRWCAVLDSDVYDMQLSYAGGGGDAQAWGGGFGKYLTNVGFWKFDNDSVSASTMASLYCGAFTEPLSPSTGFDGVPHDTWQTHQLIWKNPLMDTQIGQTQGTSVSIGGQSYGPAPDQEFLMAPATIQVAVNQSYQVQTWTANDSNAGINRAPAGTATLACGGGTCGTVAVAFQNVGSGIHNSQNQFVTTFSAPATIPPGGQTTLTRCFKTPDDRLATLGSQRNMCASTVFTIVASNPTHQMVVGPQAPDLKIQPSYSDIYGNNRQFCLIFNAIPNFTSTSTTWDVDGSVGGNSIVGTIDTSGLYCSPSTTGSHTINATASDNTQGSSTITVSNSAPIVAFDGRVFTSKNCWELKCGNRTLFENSVAQLAWGSAGNGGGQNGEALLAQSLNQANQTKDGSGNIVGYGPEYINDTTVRYVKFIHTGEGFTIAGKSSSLGLHRFSIANVLCDDCNYIHWGHGFTQFMFSVRVGGGGSTIYSWEAPTNPILANVSVTHTTIVGADLYTIGVNSDVAQPKMINYRLQDSFFASNQSATFLNPNGGSTNCNIAQGSGANNSEVRALVPCFNGYVFNHLALIDSSASPSVFLSSPIWRPVNSAVGFVNYNGGNGGDYRLCTGVNLPAAPCAGASIFTAGQANQASDGKDLGADIVGINAVESTVRGGIRTP